MLSHLHSFKHHSKRNIKFTHSTFTIPSSKTHQVAPCACLRSKIRRSRPASNGRAITLTAAYVWELLLLLPGLDDHYDDDHYDDDHDDEATAHQLACALLQALGFHQSRRACRHVLH